MADTTSTAPAAAPSQEEKPVEVSDAAAATSASDAPEAPATTVAEDNAGPTTEADDGEHQ
jgi:hypothetical protein